MIKLRNLGKRYYIMRPSTTQLAESWTWTKEESVLEGEIHPYGVALVWDVEDRVACIMLSKEALEKPIKYMILISAPTLRELIPKIQRAVDYEYERLRSIIGSEGARQVKNLII